MSKELKVGLFAIISGSILYLGFNYLKGIDFFSTSNKYYAVYNNIDGLNVSNPVIINGYAIGRVSNIKILQNKNNRVLVELDVKGDLIIGENTKAILMNSDFLGSKAILLEIGDISKPLNPGDTLKAGIDKGLEAILERAQPLTDDIGVTISRMNEILLGMEGAGEEIIETLQSLKNTTYRVNEFISSSNGSINRTLDQANKIMSNVNAKVSQLQPILTNANSTLEKINAVEVDSTLIHLNEAINELEAVLVSINSGEGTLGKLVKDDTLHTQLNQTLVDLDKLLIHFDENPKHFMAPLGKSKKKIAAERAKEAN